MTDKRGDLAIANKAGGKALGMVWVWISFLGLFLLLLVIAIFVELATPTWFFVHQKTCCVLGPFAGVRFSAVGFLTPLAISTLLVLVFRRRLVSGIRTLLPLWGYLVMAAISIMSAFVLPKGLVVGPVGGTAIPLLFLVTFFLADLLSHRLSRVVPLAYVLGFGVGVVSDFGSLGQISAPVFGGVGLFDGDFLEPLLLAVAAAYILVILRAIDRRRNRFAIQHNQ